MHENVAHWTRNGECVQVAIRSSRARVDQVVDEEHPPSSTGRTDTILAGGCAGVEAQVPCEARNPCAPPCLVDVESALGRKMRRRCRRTFVVACEKDDPDPPNDCRRKAVELEAQESAILAR